MPWSRPEIMKLPEGMHWFRFFNEIASFLTCRIENERNNYYRLRRAVEIVLGNDSTMAELSVDVHKPLDYDFRCFFLYRPRMELYKRIEHRCESMVILNEWRS